VAIYGAINFGAINLLLQKMEQFYGAIIWYHLMAPFYGMCVPGIRDTGMTFADVAENQFVIEQTIYKCGSKKSLKPSSILNTSYTTCSHL